MIKSDVQSTIDEAVFEAATGAVDDGSYEVIDEAVFGAVYGSATGAADRMVDRAVCGAVEEAMRD
jgi:hypothetical protein